MVDFFMYSSKVIPLGLETPAETREKRHPSSEAGTQTGTESEIDPEFCDLNKIWKMLSKNQKEVVIEFAESLRQRSRH